MTGLSSRADILHVETETEFLKIQTGRFPRYLVPRNYRRLSQG